MLHLLQLEWKKLKSYRVFQVLTLLYIILMPPLFVAARNMFLNSGLPSELGDVNMFFSFPKVWYSLAYLGNWLTFFFFGFLAIVALTSEFNNKTLRQNIITGMSRQDFWLGKVLMMAVISILAAIYYGIWSVIFGYIFTDYVASSRVFMHIDLIPRFALMCFAYMSFAFMMGMLIRRTGLAIFLYFAYTFFMEYILRFLHYKFIDKTMQTWNYYPLNVFEDLCPLPFANDAAALMKNNDFTFFLSSGEAVFVSSIYIVLFLFISYRTFMIKDI